MRPDIALIIGGILGLIGTITLFIIAMPKKLDGKLNKYLQFVHDYFHFKQLYIERVLKFFFMLCTLVLFLTGFFMLFGRNFLTGLIMMIVSPIVLRLVYESMLMFILLVQNVLDINNKLKGEGNARKAPEFASGDEPLFNVPDFTPKPAAAPAAPAEEPKPATFCPNCGTKVDGNTFCPNCGTKL